MAILIGRVVDIVDGAAGRAIIDRLSTKYIGAPYPLREGRVALLVEVDARQQRRLRLGHPATNPGLRRPPAM